MQTVQAHKHAYVYSLIGSATGIALEIKESDQISPMNSLSVFVVINLLNGMRDRTLNLPGRTDHALAVLYIFRNVLNIISGNVLKLLLLRSKA